MSTMSTEPAVEQPSRTWRSRIRLTGSSALALSTILSNVVRIVSTMCLTRLLSPDVYGITGLIMSVFYVVNMITDIGLQAYVVRHERSDEPDFLSSVFTIHAIRGCVLAAIGMLLAWPLSVVLAKPQVALPLAVASLVFVIDGLISLHQFRAIRDGRVQRYAVIDVATVLTQTICAIILAFFLRNVWAIVASLLIASAVRVWVGYALFPGSRHAFRPDQAVSADLWQFSKLIAVSSALTLVITQVDKLAMGRILSLAQFGTYVIASSLASAPTVFAYNYVSGIVYPAVAGAWREGASLADAYYRCWGKFFYLYALGGGTLIGVADLLIRLLYDPRYAAAATYLSILAVSTALTMINRSMETVQVATGRQRIGVQLNLVRLAWLAVGGVIAFVEKAPLLFVLTIGLVEVPIYFVSAWRMKQLHALRVSRELSFTAVLGTGIAAGLTLSYVSRLLLPNL